MDLPSWLTPFAAHPDLPEVLERRRQALTAHPGALAQVLTNARLEDAGLEAALGRERGSPWLRALHPPPAWGASPHRVLRAPDVHAAYGARLVVGGGRACVATSTYWLAWDLGSGALLASGSAQVIPSPDARFVLAAAGSERGAWYELTESGPEPRGALGGEFTGAAFQPGGTLVAALHDNGLRCWDRQSGAPVHGAGAGWPGFATLEWSPDGAWLVVCGRRGLRVVDGRSGAVLLDHPEGLFNEAGSAAVWDATGRRIFAFNADAPSDVRVIAPLEADCVSARPLDELPDLAAHLPAMLPFLGAAVERWEPERWSLVQRLVVGGREPVALATDGQSAATLVDDGSLHVWEAPWPAPPPVAAQHPAEIEAVGLVGQTHAWTSGGGAVCVWAAEGTVPVAVLPGTIDSGGDPLLAVRQAGAVLLVDAATGAPAARVAVSCLRATAAGGRLYTCELRDGGTVLVERTQEGDERHSWPVTGEVRRLEVDRDGVRVETGTYLPSPYALEPPDWVPTWRRLTPGGLEPCGAPVASARLENGVLTLPGPMRLPLDEAGDTPNRVCPPLAVAPGGSAPTRVAVGWGRRLLLYELRADRHPTR